DRAPAARTIAHLQFGRYQQETSVMGADVVARERVIGPAGEQEDRPIRNRAEVERQGMKSRVSAKWRKRKPGRIPAVGPGNQFGDVASIVVSSGRHVFVFNSEQPIWLRNLGHPLVGIDLNPGWVCDRDELHPIGKEGLFELVRDTNFKSSALRL